MRCYLGQHDKLRRAEVICLEVHCLDRIRVTRRQPEQHGITRRQAMFRLRLLVLLVLGALRAAWGQPVGVAITSLTDFRAAASNASVSVFLLQARFMILLNRVVAKLNKGTFIT